MSKCTGTIWRGEDYNKKEICTAARTSLRKDRHHGPSDAEEKASGPHEAGRSVYPRILLTRFVGVSPQPDSAGMITVRGGNTVTCELDLLTPAHPSGTRIADVNVLYHSLLGSARKRVLGPLYESRTIRMESVQLPTRTTD
jgi:hypothetical protein